MAFENLGTEAPEVACASILTFIREQAEPVRLNLLQRDLADRLEFASTDNRSRGEYGTALLEALRGDLSGQASPGLGGVASTESANIFVITVIDVERRAALQAFGVDPDAYESRGHRRYYRTTVEAARTSSTLKVLITSINRPWNAVAAATVARFRSEHKADAFFLVGIAAGLETRVNKGDVVVPESVYYYEPGRSRPSEFGRRPGHPEVDEGLRTNLGYYRPGNTDYYSRLQTLLAGVPSRESPADGTEEYEPAYHFDNVVVASGERLIEDGMLAELARDVDERIQAGDEESFGFAEALHGERWAIVRGISDYGVLPKPKDWQYVSALAGALAIRDFLETEYEDPDKTAF